MLTFLTPALSLIQLLDSDTNTESWGTLWETVISLESLFKALRLKRPTDQSAFFFYYNYIAFTMNREAAFKKKKTSGADAEA